MSLISFLNGKTEKEIAFQNTIKQIQPKKSDFKTLSGKNAFSSEFKVYAPYELTKSSHSMIVGTTFDYLARIQIAQAIQIEKNNFFNHIVASNFFKKYKESIDSSKFETLEVKYKKVLKYIEKFINSSDKVNCDLIEQVFYLARLEQCWRGNRLPDDLETLLNCPYDEIVNDLINLAQTFEENFINKIIKPNSIVLFNPTFGKCSYMIGGADADIYIDGVLYDFKTSKGYGYKGKDVQQIMSYYIFSKISIENEDLVSSFVQFEKDFYNVNRVAIYLARFGEINYIDIKSIDKENINNCSKKIIELLNI